MLNPKSVCGRGSLGLGKDILWRVIENSQGREDHKNQNILMGINLSQ